MHILYKRAVVSAIAVIIYSCCAGNQYAQSSSVDFPSPITSSELSGSIKARDVGDSRLTTYYYWFEGTTGDMFINLVTKNFAGDVDIFAQSGLKSLTKIVVYPDFGEIETGRVIYLRKPEKLLLRVQGRSPNDDPAQFRFKFAGGFVAGTESKGDAVETPTVADGGKGSVRVNSVGTRIPPKEVPLELKNESVKTEEVATEKEKEKEKVVPDDTKVAVDTESSNNEADQKKEIPKLEVVVTDETKLITAPLKPTISRSSRRRVPKASATENKTNDERGRSTVESDVMKDGSEAQQGEVERTSEPVKKAEKVDPLANVQLVIVFKDGKKIERPLPEVFRFSVDRGVLTVVSRDGRIGKYQMVDVLRVTIE